MCVCFILTVGGGVVTRRSILTRTPHISLMPPLYQGAKGAPIKTGPGLESKSLTLPIGPGLGRRYGKHPYLDR